MTDTSHSEAPPSPDTRTDFLQLYSRHELEIRAFVRSCVASPTDVDEVMQEVSLIAWRKFPTLSDPALFARWTCLIARFEVLKFRRSRARDRLVLDEDIIERLAEEGVEETPVRQDQLEALESCLEKLPPDRRELAITAYAPESSIRELATRAGRTEGSLYQLLARIRQELLRCVERTLAKESQ